MIAPPAVIASAREQAARTVKGGMFAFPDVAGLIERRGWTNATDCAEFLLNEAHVAIVSGEVFGSSRHIRINFTIAEARLHEAIKRIAAALT